MRRPHPAAFAFSFFLTAASFLGSSARAVAAPLPQPAGLTPVITASRVDGVAPLPVFFDALASSVDCDVRHEALCLWEFSDPASGRFAVSEGFSAGHVFEQPGQYVISLLIVHPYGHFAITRTTINVRPFVGTSWFVSSSTGNDGNDGLAETRPLQSFDRALQLFDAALPRNATPVPLRVLFKRGDVFQTSIGYSFGHNRAGAPAIFSAYGSGPLPVIWNTGTQPTFFGLSEVSGLRFVDLEMRGSYDFATQTGNRPISLYFHEGRDRCALRCNFHSTELAWVETGDDLLRREHIFMVDCDAHDMFNQCAYLGGRRLCVLGNRMTRASDSPRRVWRIGA